MRHCPHCTKAMLLTSEPRGRVYYCSPCDFVSVPLDPKLSLSVETIAEDMKLRLYVDARQEAAKQAWCRRMSGQLEELNVGRQYLSQVEIDTLMESARILDKIASAADLARQSKHHQQLEAEQNQQLRYQKALAEIDCSDLYDEDNVIELALHALTQSELRGDVLPALDVDRINWIIAQAPSSGSIVFFLINQLKGLIQEQRSGIAFKLAAEQGALESKMNRLRSDYLKLRPGIQQKHYAVIDAIQNILSLDQRHWQ